MKDVSRLDCTCLLGTLCFLGWGMLRRRGRCLKLVRASHSICKKNRICQWVKIKIYLLYFVNNFTLTSIRTDRVGGLRNCGQLPAIVRFVDGPCQSELFKKKRVRRLIKFPFDIQTTEFAHCLIWHTIVAYSWEWL